MNKDLKILVTGVNGQLGYDCVKELSARGYHNVLGIDIQDLDITDEEKTKHFIINYRPDVVMHNAAWTQVDKAEENKELVYKVNALGPKYIAEACQKIGAKMVYISTDYVFDGLGDKPFEVDDRKSGLSTYGTSKSQGEDFVKGISDRYFIVRISWVFGINGNNFIKTMLRLASTRDEINVVSDQIGSPTYTYDLAKLLCDMIETDKYGVYHATNEGYCSWYELAKYVMECANIQNVRINPITTEEYLKSIPQQAKRPLNSRLSKKSLIDNGFKLLPHWKQSVKSFVEELINKK